MTGVIIIDDEAITRYRDYDPMREKESTFQLFLPFLGSPITIMTDFLASLNGWTNGRSRAGHGIHPIRDNRADLRPRASDHAGKHLGVRHTLGRWCVSTVGVFPGNIG